MKDALEQAQQAKAKYDEADYSSSPLTTTATGY